MLKAAATNKMRVEVIGYSQGEYLHLLSNQGLIISYKSYNIAEQKDIAS